MFLSDFEIVRNHFCNIQISCLNTLLTNQNQLCLTITFFKFYIYTIVIDFE